MDNTRPIEGGRLRQRVTLMSPPATDGPRNSWNIPTAAASEVGTYWAMVRPLAGRELEVAEQLRGDVTHLVVMRWVGSIAPPQYLIFRGQRLNISAVIDVDELRRELNLYCSQPGAKDPPKNP